MLGRAARVGLRLGGPALVFLPLVLVALLAWPAPAAYAQTRAQEAEARALFEQGRGHAEAEQWIEALDAFRRSRAVAERPTTIFNIATTLIRLGRAQEAIATIAELEQVADPRQHAQLLRDAAQIRQQAEASLRHVTLRVSPEAATVEVDGLVLAGSGAERTMTLDPGAHTMVVALDGYQTERFTLDPGTDTREVTLPPLDGVLNIVPSVETARVTVDGADRGAGTLRLTMAPGTYAIGITADGYLPFDRSFDLLPGAELTVDAALEPVPVSGDLTQDPVFWGILGGAVGAAIIGAVVGWAIWDGRPTDPAYGGTSMTVIVPLVGGSF
jgi:hypothetical protein